MRRCGFGTMNDSEFDLVFQKVFWVTIPPAVRKPVLYSRDTREIMTESGRFDVMARIRVHKDIGIDKLCLKCDNDVPTHVLQPAKQKAMCRHVLTGAAHEANFDWQANTANLRGKDWKRTSLSLTSPGFRQRDSYIVVFAIVLHV